MNGGTTPTAGGPSSTGRLVPDALAVGPGRTGTTWLYKLMGGHPAIATPSIKEPEYFGTHWGRDAEWYRSLFDLSSATTVVAEFSNNYLYDIEAMARVVEHSPGARIIVGIRDPLKLARSWFTFARRRGLDPDSMGAFLELELGEVFGSGLAARRRGGTLREPDTVRIGEALHVSRYIDRLGRLVPAGQVHLFDFERLASDGPELGRDVFRFLGVDPDAAETLDPGRVNPAVLPRFPLLGRAAHLGADTLRALGLESLLGRVRSSPRVSALLFSGADRTSTGDDGFDPSEIDGLIREERLELSRIVRDDGDRRAADAGER